MVNHPEARRLRRGFTLVELMIVVAIMSVLATLAIYGVRRYIQYSKAHEAMNMIKAIKEGQESYRRETYRYLQVSSALDDYYPPRTGGEWVAKIQWGEAHGSLANWQTLNVVPDGPVYFSYSSVTGAAGTVLPQAYGPELSQSISWGPAPTDIWYVAKAVGDLNGDGDYSVFVGSSLTSEIWSENVGD